MISFDYVENNIAYIKQRDPMTWEVKRKIELDLNSLDTVNFYNEHMERDPTHIRFHWRNRTCLMDEISHFRRKCINCQEWTNTTYCKKCWKW